MSAMTAIFVAAGSSAQAYDVKHTPNGSLVHWETDTVQFGVSPSVDAIGGSRDTAVVDHAPGCAPNLDARARRYCALGGCSPDALVDVPLSAPGETPYRRHNYRANADVIGSTAKFIASMGWHRGEPWLDQGSDEGAQLFRNPGNKARRRHLCGNC